MINSARRDDGKVHQTGNPLQLFRAVQVHPQGRGVRGKNPAFPGAKAAAVHPSIPVARDAEPLPAGWHPHAPPSSNMEVATELKTAEAVPLNLWKTQNNNPDVW